MRNANGYCEGCAAPLKSPTKFMMCRACKTIPCAVAGCSNMVRRRGPETKYCKEHCGIGTRDKNRRKRLVEEFKYE